MKISLVTVFPEIYDSFLQTSIVRRAQEDGHVAIDTYGLKSFVPPKKRVDGPTFGHSAGMLLRPDVVEQAIDAAEQKHGKAFKIFFSPHGKKLDQPLLHDIAARVKNEHVMLLAARYEGMDARVEEEYADEIISIGDYVLMGGDLPAMVLLEGLLRLIPGVIGKEESVSRDSFSGPFVDYPEYTAPVLWHGKEVPEVVRSGNHAVIEEWRKNEAVNRTIKNHFNWFRSTVEKKDDLSLAAKFVPSHYAALMHTDVLVKGVEGTGTTSVTSIDIHDIARSAKTYGLASFFIVTPLKDQQAIVKTLLQFWQEGSGITYNESRYKAVKQVKLLDSLHATIENITQKEGKKPIIIATSARAVAGVPTISYYDQSEVWRHDRPVLMLFGTGMGLTQEVMERCDYILKPINGMTGYNHLSVRSAAAIIFDRWLGLNEK